MQKESESLAVTAAIQRKTNIMNEDQEEDMSKYTKEQQELYEEVSKVKREISTQRAYRASNLLSFKQLSH